MDLFKISVIIPVYNGEKFIVLAIKSVLEQTYPVHEIIIINDGSKDNTAQVLAEYKDRVLITAIPNGGVSNARNVGIETSTGDWIAFLDADDVWHKDKLKKQIEIITKYPDTGICCCNYHEYNTFLNQGISHFSRFKNDPDMILNVPLNDPFRIFIKENIFGTASTVILKKEILQKTGLFNINYKQAEDYDLWLRCALVTGCVCVSEVLVNKRTHKGNLTNDQIEMLESHRRVLMELSKSKDLIKNNQLLGTLASAQAEKSYQLGNALYEAGNWKKAFAIYFEGLSFNWSLHNIIRFLVIILKKTLRSLTFGLLSRKSLRIERTIGTT